MNLPARVNGLESAAERHDREIAEIRLILKELSESQKKTDVQIHELKEGISELRESQKKTDLQINELKESQKKTDIQINELKESQKKTDVQIKESQKKTDNQLRELSKQIGGLGNKFGSFAEGMALPSMTRVLTKQFAMRVFSPRVKSKKGSESLELDALAYNDESVYVVEIKSHFRPENLTQVLQMLANFPQFFPEHASKKLYAIITVVDIQDNLRKNVLETGIYLATIHDEQFKITVPKNFAARCFTQ